MKRITLYIVLTLIFVPPIANAEFDVNSLPNLIAPINWNISDSDVRKFAEGAEVQSNNYNAIYFDKMIKVDALIITNVKLPHFADAQVTVEKLKGRIIGIRVDTTETDSQCWHDRNRPQNCRQDDLKGLESVFVNLSRVLEKQYGPGVRKKEDSVKGRLIQWQSEQGQLMLYFEESDYDGWYVGLWIARH